MSGIDDVTWTFSSEWSRDRQLRTEIENSYSAISRANAATSRARSQLNQLQGSMESRLQRLAKAFDAYVELGDVGEQLLAYADSSATRRAVIGIMALRERRKAATDRATDLADIESKVDQAGQRVRQLETDRATQIADVEGLRQRWDRVLP